MPVLNNIILIGTALLTISISLEKRKRDLFDILTYFSCNSIKIVMLHPQ